MNEQEKLRSRAAIDRAVDIAGGFKWLASATGIGKTRLHNCKTGRYELSTDEAFKIEEKTGVAFSALRPDVTRKLRKTARGKVNRRPSKPRNKGNNHHGAT